MKTTYLTDNTTLDNATNFSGFISNYRKISQSNPLKRYFIRKEKKIYSIEAEIEDLECDNYKVIINNGFLNITIASPKKFDDNQVYYIMRKSAIILPGSKYNILTSAQFTKGKLYIEIGEE